MPLLELVGLVEAFEVLVVVEARGVEELLEAAVVRVNRERAVMVREPMFRERMMQHPAVLLRLYQGISMEEDHMMVEEERKVDTMNSGGVLPPTDLDTKKISPFWTGCPCLPREK